VHRSSSFFGFPARVRAPVALAAAALLAASVPARAQSPRDDDRDPPLSSVVDSAALVRAAAALDLAPPHGMRPLFTIVVDTAGRATVKPIVASMPASYAEPVVAAIRASLKPQSPAAHARYVHLRVVTGARARVDQPPVSERQPSLANATAVSRALAQAASRHADRLRGAGVGRYVTVMRFRVLADGHADTVSASVFRSGGDELLDAEALRVVGTMRFRPAAIENVPVPVWVTLPLSFALPSSAERGDGREQVTESPR